MKIPRPRDGWRIFAGEVGVIVLGVLIALLAQQVAEEWQWQQTVARTKADLDGQLSWSIVQVAERKAVDRCLTQRLSADSRSAVRPSKIGPAEGSDWQPSASLISLAPPFCVSSIRPLTGREEVAEL